MGVREWFALIKYISRRYREVESLFRVVGRARPHFPLLRIPAFVLPDKFHVIGRSIGASTFLETAKMEVDLSDFEMV
jgi:hypothetical protein